MHFLLWYTSSIARNPASQNTATTKKMMSFIPRKAPDGCHVELTSAVHYYCCFYSSPVFPRPEFSLLKLWRQWLRIDVNNLSPAPSPLPHIQLPFKAMASLSLNKIVGRLLFISDWKKKNPLRDAGRGFLVLLLFISPNFQFKSIVDNLSWTKSSFWIH